MLREAIPKDCRKSFHLKVGTVFEDSPLGLDKWLPVMWMIVNAKNGISSCELHRALGVTQKTAWFMLQRARLAMQDEHTGGKLSGEVEIDETFIGGKARNMHKSRKAKTIGKVGVQGMLERGGKIRAKVIDNTQQATLQGNIEKHMQKPALPRFH